MTSTIILKQNNTSGSAPSAGSLVAGEVAVNTADGVLYTKHTDGTVKTVAPVNVSNLPIIRPSLLLDFANSKSLDPRITFTRASTATYTGTDGLIKTAASGAARFDHNPTTGESLGLLIEEQRTNLLTYSENFDNAVWNKSSTTVTANAATAPDGTLTADKIIPNTTLGQHLIEVVGANVTGTTQTLSVFAKSSGLTSFTLTSWGIPDVVFNLTTGTHNLLTPTASLLSASINLVGNGWYRCSLTINRTDSNLACHYIGIPTTGNYTGDGTSGIYLWGAQLEQGAFATSYIPSNDTFTSRASTGTYIGSNGLIQSAATNVARMNYTPTNLALSPKLLLEPAATNLLKYSEDFDNAAWVKSAATVTANAITAPDGTLTADKLVESNSTGFHNLYQSYTPLSAAITWSVYVKAAEHTTIRLNSYESVTPANPIIADFNLSTVTSTAVSGSTIATSIVPVGNGWFRISATTNTAALVGTTWSIFTKGGTSYAGDGTSGIYIWGAQLEAGTTATSYIPTTDTFTSRASTGTYIGSNGLIQSAATNVARYSYNPSNLGIAGKLLLEPAATNLLTYSEQFNMWSAWQLNTTTANATTAPDGNATADKIIENSSTNVHNIAQPVNVTSGTTYTMSCYIKAAERFKANLVFWTNNSAFPLTGLTIDLISGAFSVSGNQIAYSVIPHSSGWYRCSITQTASATAVGTLYIGILNDSGVESYTGNGTSGIYIWGAQLETGTTATSYIPTTSAQVTRAADVSSSAQTTRAADVSSSAQTTRAADNAVMTGTNFSSWYRQDEGTVFAKADSLFKGANFIASMHNDTNADSINIYVRDNLSQFEINTNSINQANLNVTSSPTFDFAGGYKVNDFSVSYSGSSVLSDSSGTVPQTNQASLGSWFSNLYLNGHIAKLAYYPKRLSNTELQAITRQ